MGERMTQAELDAADALANAATPEPWTPTTHEATMNDRSEWRFGDLLKPKVFSAVVRQADAEFIAAARELVPRLVAEVRARDAVIEAVRDAILLAVDGPSMTIDGKRAIQGVLDVLATPDTERVKLFNPDGTARTNAEIRTEAARILEAQLVSRALEGGVK
jgi:hypothetical protein